MGDDMAVRVQLATKYRSDPELFVSRIQVAISQVMAHPAVDADNIFVAGYCLGGTGAVDYGFSAGALKNVKAVVPLHGGLTPLRAIQTDVVQPYVLVLSGGVDDAHGNTTELEAHLDGASAKWEISRYSNAQHGFTKWGSGAYQTMADSRSWWSMMSLFEALEETTEENDMKSEEMVMTEESSSHDGEDHEDHEGHDHDHDHSGDDKDMDMDASMADSSANGVSVVGALAAAALLAAL